MSRTFRSSFALVLLAAAASHARAQSTQAPNIILSVNFGVTTGGHLWAVPRQAVHGGFAGGQTGYDTLSMGRRLSPGVVGTVMATLHRSPHFGYVAEVGYFGVGSEGRCSVLGTVPDGETKTQQACTALQGTTYRTSVVGFQAGVTYRVTTGTFSPYMRATAGVGALGNSYIESGGLVVANTTCGGVCNWTLLHEAKRHSITYLGTLAIGLTIRAGQGYQLRLEARDLIAGLPVVTDSTGIGGPEPFPTARTGTRTRHVYVVTAGVDILLERRHRRRY